MTISFLADECFSGSLVRAMRAAKLDVERSADILPAAPDEQALALSFAQGRVLLSEDDDFGDLAVRLGLPTHGVVRVALKSLNKPDRALRLVRALSTLGNKVQNALVTIEPSRSRVRPLIR